MRAGGAELDLTGAMGGHQPDETSWDVSARIAFLSLVPLFHDLPPETIAGVAEGMRLRRVRQGQLVFQTDAPAEAVSLLASGRVKVIRETEDEREVILRLIHPGEIFGGAGAWGERAYPASAVALDDAVVLELPTADFAALIARYPDFALALIREIARRLREAETRIQDLQTERVERRVARMLLRLARRTGVATAQGIAIDPPLSRQDLAELAGTTVSTVSRTLRALDQRGLIRAGREQIIILQPHALVTLAEDLDPLG